MGAPPAEAELSGLDLAFLFFIYLVLVAFCLIVAALIGENERSEKESRSLPGAVRHRGGAAPRHAA